MIDHMANIHQDYLTQKPSEVLIHPSADCLNIISSKLSS